MLEIVWEYRYVLIGIAFVALFAIFEWSEFKAKAYALMLQAKSLAKDLILQTGQAQEDWVVEKIYIIMPAFLRLAISKELLRKIIKFLYDKAKDYIDDGQINNSNIE